MIGNIHAAKTLLSKLIARMQAGEEVIIARSGQPVARLTPLVGDRGADRRGGTDDLPAWMGSLHGKIQIAPDVDEDFAGVTQSMQTGEIWPADPSSA